MGAGHGVQSVSLAKIGFNVTAVDFNDELLEELEINAKGLNIKIVNSDIKNVNQFAYIEPELIIWCGDTISHLENLDEIKMLIKDVSGILKSGGKILFSFRDCSHELTGDNRFIPVKSDNSRILTCVLEYSKDSVKVTDLLNEKTQNGWVQKVSSYNKVRISPELICKFIEANEIEIQLNKAINRMTYVIAIKV